MKTVEIDEQQRLPVKKENVISMPLGLLGFEQVKKYILLVTPEEEPFLWLQMLDNQNQGFVVISPSAAVPTYAPDIPEADIEFLNIKSPADALILNIVTVRNGQATVNLKGPIVINRHTLVGKQCIPTNVAEFALQHPINPVPVAA
ncbi:MAG: flagellar assembly protein FliW [Verrucomicrobia bacterium]|jgi:flagellar assembly factor FliW|nr:flagellar assembly protein FliW [Verrucomicrobiota bacterium]